MIQCELMRGSGLTQGLTEAQGSGGSGRMQEREREPRLRLAGEADIEDFQGSVSVGSELSSKRSRGWDWGSGRVGFKGKGSGR